VQELQQVHGILVILRVSRGGAQVLRRVCFGVALMVWDVLATSVGAGGVFVASASLEKCTGLSGGGGSSVNSSGFGVESTR